MAKKQVIVNETAAAAPATPARAAKPKAPRVTASKHSKVVSTDAPASEVVPVAVISENPQEAVAKIAYGFWESRGYEGGSPLEDWVRAEHEYRQRIAATRL